MYASARVLGFASLLLASMSLTATAATRGYIDCQWNSGYVLRSNGGGQFVVCPGCSGLSPVQYRSFADQVFVGTSHDAVGYGWYLGGAYAPASAVQSQTPILPPPELPVENPFRK